MSINHHFSTAELQQTLWWLPHQSQKQNDDLIMESPDPNITSNPTIDFWSNPQFIQNSNLSFDLNNNNNDIEESFDEIDRNKEEEEGEEEEIREERKIPIPREILFEKALTPSDVGKLNRLVIPKQHAEKYFPINGVSESGEKGLLLSFEDELAKHWRFRYSYWNSSQSYVLTKGWSRFVKEKRLDAGDVVRFERHGVDTDRLFIGWRRRRPPGATAAAESGAPHTGGTVGGGCTQLLLSVQPYPGQPHAPAPPYQPDSFHAAAEAMERTRTSEKRKRLRLFGVNMECQVDEAAAATPPSDDSGASSASSSQGPDPPPSVYPIPFHSYPANTHLETRFPRDISQRRHHWQR